MWDTTLRELNRSGFLARDKLGDHSTVSEIMERAPSRSSSLRFSLRACCLMIEIRLLTAHSATAPEALLTQPAIPQLVPRATT